MSISPSQTVNEVIREFPQTLPVFAQYGIDSCCGGAKTLGTVAEKHGLPLPELLEKLTAASK